MATAVAWSGGHLGTATGLPTVMMARCGQYLRKPCGNPGDADNGLPKVFHLNSNTCGSGCGPDQMAIAVNASQLAGPMIMFPVLTYETPLSALAVGPFKRRGGLLNPVHFKCLGTAFLRRQ